MEKNYTEIIALYEEMLSHAEFKEKDLQQLEDMAARVKELKGELK